MASGSIRIGEDAGKGRKNPDNLAVPGRLPLPSLPGRVNVPVPSARMMEAGEAPRLAQREYGGSVCPIV
jgi:hypothetical protein